ncbi:hypothetical protein ACFWOL_15275 [Streptomyces sp. NPDC058442]|uniref:hypothetical protein n=1 Tax=Streptomyces sp. NPDC058442 TaxID=3346503 RepID=UPI00366235D8
MVRMRHPNVEQEIEVPEISVTHYERSGWKRVDGQAVTGQATPVVETAAAKGRRRSEEGN